MAPSSRFTTEDSLRGLGAIEILDEAASLLRRAPLSIISIYFLGALPFCLGLIYFFSDMAQSVNASARLPGEALGVTALYFWMKTCQAVFSRKLLALLEGEDTEPWTVSRWLHIALLQAVYAGSLMIVYPMAMLITIPFAWVNAFYHNISILATSRKSTLGSSLREAGEMARLWPKQNHLILGVLLLAFLVLFLNLAFFWIAVPGLLNSLFGVQTVFDDNLLAWNNSSFYLDLLIFCFLLLNPLNKAVFVLRCFYGRSRLSGADLRSELRRRRPAATKTLRVVALLCVLIFAVPVHAATVPVPPVPVAAQTTTEDPAASNLDQAIQKTLKRDEFAWRLPREKESAGDANFLTKLVHRLGEYIKDLLKGPMEMLRDYLKWLFDNQRDHDSQSQSLSALASVPWRFLLVLAAIILLGVLVYFVFRHYRRQKRGPTTVLKPAAMRTIDLEAENVQADELPEDSWLALAQELIERGELRLALRAFYLATLSSLARRELVRLSATKSNRDYLAELTRRLRGETSVVPFFRENVRLFEASWYGTHAVTDAVLASMRSNQQQVQGHAAA